MTSAIQTLKDEAERIDKAVTRHREMIARHKHEIAGLEGEVSVLCRAKEEHLAAVERLEDRECDGW